MRIFSFSPFGYEGALVSVEVDLRRGIPSIDVVGLADGAVKESRERMRAAIRNSGFEFPPERVLISLSPADVKKEGAGFDLPIALAVLIEKASQEKEFEGSFLVMGELDLSGNIKPVRGIHAAVSTAIENNIRYCVVPYENKEEAFIPGACICPVKDLSEAFTFLTKGNFENFVEVEKQKEEELRVVKFMELSDEYEYSVVKNQGKLIRGLQIAAAGGHNVIAYGPPGCGKTLAMQKFPGLLPCLTSDESCSVTRIYSLAGLISAGGKMLENRPFRSPHQSASIEGMIGGGVHCMPGEVSLAHNGVLFLDEAAEFKTSVLQMLRIPLETGCVTLSRAGRHTVYPADFQLLVASNPCPCGNYGSDGKICICSARAVEQYWKKFSAPLLDRIDIRIPLLCKDESGRFKQYDGITTSELRKQISNAVLAQRKRQGKFNARLKLEDLKTKILIEDDAQKMLEEEVIINSFSGRAQTSILKVARTIADMELSEKVRKKHMEEAVFYRKNEGGLDFCF